MPQITKLHLKLHLHKRHIIKNEKVFPKILISGGYGEIISKNLSVKNKYERNLVLKSLGIISDLS